MKTEQTTQTPCGGPRSAVQWGRTAGYGIAIGTALGTVVGVAVKQTAFVYAGMLLGAVLGAIFKSRQAKEA